MDAMRASNSSLLSSGAPTSATVCTAACGRGAADAPFAPPNPVSTSPVVVVIEAGGATGGVAGGAAAGTTESPLATVGMVAAGEDGAEGATTEDTPVGAGLV